MASVNKVILVGYLGQDPEVRYGTTGLITVANISLATTSAWNDKNTGERREETDWHRVVFYGKQAEIVSQYLKKGSAIYIDGRLKTRKWTDKQGVDRYVTEVISEQVQFLSPKSSGSVTATAATANPRVTAKVATTQTAVTEPVKLVEELDDIPF